MNKVALDLGFIRIYWYSITMFLAILVGTIFCYKQLKKENYKEDFIIDLIFYTIIFAIIGARLYYVLFNLDYYLEYKLEIFEIWNGGLAIHGGLLAGFIFIIYYCKKHKVNPLKIFDKIALILLLSQSIGRWGNFFNQEAYGPITDISTLKSLFIPNFIIKGMYINGNYHHPTFFYEGMWNILGFLVLFFINKTKNLRLGQLTGMYLMWYSFGRFIIESLRVDSLMFFNFKIAQLVSIILFLIGLYLNIPKSKNSRYQRLKERMENDEVRL